MEKKKALDEESGSALMSGVANLFGKGKYADIEKENARLTAENKDMQFAVTQMEAQVAKIPMMVQRQVRQTIEDKTEEHLTEIQELNASHSRELSSLQVRLQNLSASPNDTTPTPSDCSRLNVPQRKEASGYFF